MSRSKGTAMHITTPLRLAMEDIHAGRVRLVFWMRGAGRALLAEERPRVAACIGARPIVASAFHELAARGLVTWPDPVSLARRGMACIAGTAMPAGVAAVVRAPVSLTDAGWRAWHAARA